MDHFTLRIDYHLMPVYAALTSVLIFISVFFLKGSVEPRKGDVRGAKTYAYGSVRLYPRATYYQIAEELFFMVYYYCIAFSKNGYRSFTSVLAGEGLVQTFRKSKASRSVILLTNE